MKTWQTQDRSNWTAGIVDDNEPDKAQWIDETTGLDCLIVRNIAGALCGYVGVPPSHKEYGLNYNKSEADGYDDFYVHGGLTFSDFCDPSENEETSICHTGDVANPKVWWFGFDCIHLRDLAPNNIYSFSNDAYIYQSGIYRNFDYVKDQVTKLAYSLANI